MYINRNPMSVVYLHISLDKLVLNNMSIVKQKLVEYIPEFL